MFSRSRYGGLRCPSEPAALKWTVIDWERNRFTVHSSNIEHVEGRENAVVPIFPELRPCRVAAAASCGTSGNAIKKVLEGKGLGEVYPVVGDFLKTVSMTPRGSVAIDAKLYPVKVSRKRKK